MYRSRMIDSIILMVLLIGVSTFPVNMFVKDLFSYYLIEALMMLAVLLFILFYETRHPEVVPFKKKPSTYNLLWLSPLFLVTVSNFIYALFLHELPSYSFELYHVPKVFFIILNVVVEEFVFRRHLLGNLAHPKKIINILISAGIFALCHITLFLSTFNPFDLIVVAYAFGLGMILGFIYCYGRSFIACIVFHLLFNLINDYLFETFFYVSDALWYYLINLIIAVIAAIYLLLVYLFVFEKKPSISRLN